MNVTARLQNQILGTNDDNQKTRSQIRKDRDLRDQEKLQQFLNESDESTKRKMETLNQKGVSNWLTVLPLKDEGYELSKQEFWDAIRIRYDWPIDRIPTYCPCGAKFDVAHALSCKKGGFITLRHNEVRDITAKLLEEVCVDVRKEPILLPIGNEDLPNQANKSREARLDISALNFWTNGQRAFFDVRALTYSLSDTSIPKSITALSRMKTRRNVCMANAYDNPKMERSHHSYSRLTVQWAWNVFVSINDYQSCWPTSEKYLSQSWQID